MNKNSNHYEILGLHIQATPDDIKQAYRKLVKMYHPDHNSNAEATSIFQRIQEAYETLMDADRRAAYDETFTFSENHPALVSAEGTYPESYIKHYARGLWKSFFIAVISGVISAYLYYFVQFSFGISVMRHSLLHPIEYALNQVKYNNTFAGCGLAIVLVFFVLAHVNKFRKYAGECCIILFLAFIMIGIMETISGNGSLLFTDEREQRLFSFAESGQFEVKFDAPIRKIKYNKSDASPYIEEVGLHNGLHYFVRINGDGEGTMIGQRKEHLFRWD